MDIGRKCLIMGMVGAIIAIFSSIFVLDMIFRGRPIDMPVERKILEPFPPNIFGPIYSIIDNKTVPYKVMEIVLNPGEGRENYKVLLKVETNGTIDVLVSSINSTFNFIKTFNAGNHTEELHILKSGTYLLNVTDIKGDKVGTKFKIVESWYYRKIEIVFEPDLIKTVGSIVGFILGISLLVSALIRLRKEIREARLGTVEKSKTQRRYIEVEEE